jgi:hypothetical protein
VVPIPSALLRNASSNLVIDGVFHAPETQAPRWFGSEEVVDIWLTELNDVLD